MNKKYLTFLSSLTRNIGIDLGTTKSLVYVKGKGIVINEPTIVALNNKTNQIIAVGREAVEMIGKTPPHISAIKPLTNGVISDFEVTEKMIRYFLEKIGEKSFLQSLFNLNRLIISIPCGGTEVEKRAVEDVAKLAGVREVHLIEEPIAVALGLHLPIRESKGIFIVDIGGGVTEAAVVSLGGIVVYKSIRIAGNRLNDDIILYIRDNYKLAIGEQTAENIKVTIGSVIDTGSNQEMKIKGRDLTKGLPKEIKIKEDTVREAILPSVLKIVDAIQNTLEITPPELVADILNSGIYLSGGTALLKGIDKLISDTVNLPVHVIEDPITSVIRGIGVVLEDLDNYRDILININREKPPV
ncbi:MAG: rod shape-determining protein [Minisyncoccia bacterium]|jgi:rod shape-determining protein MreB